jgi:hypothetical protein
MWGTGNSSTLSKHCYCKMQQLQQRPVCCHQRALCLLLHYCSENCTAATSKSNHDLGRLHNLTLALASELARGPTPITDEANPTCRSSSMRLAAGSAALRFGASAGCPSSTAAPTADSRLASADKQLLASPHRPPYAAAAALLL